MANSLVTAGGGSDPAATSVSSKPEQPVEKDTRLWMYRIGADGSVESKLFDSPAAIPADEGWVDNPAKAKPAAKKAAAKPKAKDGEDA
jgi:hypothetical protein